MEDNLQKLVRKAKEKHVTDVEIHFGVDFFGHGKSYIHYFGKNDLLFEEKSNADMYELLQRAKLAQQTLKKAHISTHLFIGKEFSLDKHPDMLAKIYAEHAEKEKDN